MTLNDQLKAMGPWYHSIDLGNGVLTPGHPFENGVWSTIRTERIKTSYQGKKVLDLATFEGMWAFDAERLGASLVIGVDTNYRAYERFQFCKQSLGSKVIGFYNVPMFDIVNRLDVYWNGRNIGVGSEELAGDKEWRFDIIQHLGVFYHLMDPVTSLLQSRSLIAENGTLLLETLARSDGECVMSLNDSGGKTLSGDPSVYWVPTEPCLNVMLKLAGFEVLSRTWADKGKPLSRICLTAKPTTMYNEALRVSRNYGYCKL